MFIKAFILAIIIGYLLKGRLKNLDKVNINKMYIILIAFVMEFSVVTLIGKGILKAGYLTYTIDLIMYGMVALFIYLNRKNAYLVIMAFGFILNAVPIFFNGGTMPVSLSAIDKVGLTHNISTEGLYSFVSGKTKFAFLSDIISTPFVGKFAFSIGDVIAALALMAFIITGMKGMNQNLKIKLK